MCESCELVTNEDLCTIVEYIYQVQNIIELSISFRSSQLEETGLEKIFITPLKISSLKSLRMYISSCKNINSKWIETMLNYSILLEEILDKLIIFNYALL